MVFRFDDHVLDIERRELRRGAEPVALEPQVFDLLVYLVRNRGRVVTKDDLIDGVWGGRIVSDSALTTRLNAARRAVNDSGAEQRVIRTVPRRGVRFIGEVSEEGEPEEIAALTAAADRPAATRLSIVVLPFDNLSNDPGQQYFADGITGDLTTDLSRIPDMLVISRNTAFTYRSKPVDTRQIGRELGVRYVLEGSVRRSGNQVRVNAQLIDAEADAHLWAERFDGDTSDLFALQDELTSRIAAGLNLEVISAEAARRTHNPDALDYILRARAARAKKPPSRDVFAEVASLLEHALLLDPQSADAKSHLASLLAGAVLDAMTDTPTADIERAKVLSEEALAASPRSPLAHYAMGNVLRAQRRYAEAIPEFETALALDRNRAFAYFALGQCKLFTGSLEETIPLTERAIRLSPREGQIGVWYGAVGLVHLLQSRTDEAVTWLERARNRAPIHSAFRSHLAAAYALNGETERAAVELAEARRLSVDDRFSSLARLEVSRGYWGVPSIRALFETTYFRGLRLAGMPEE